MEITAISPSLARLTTGLMASTVGLLGGRTIGPTPRRNPYNFREFSRVSPGHAAHARGLGDPGGRARAGGARPARPRPPGGAPAGPAPRRRSAAGTGVVP